MCESNWVLCLAILGATTAAIALTWIFICIIHWFCFVNKAAKTVENDLMHVNGYNHTTLKSRITYLENKFIELENKRRK